MQFNGIEVFTVEPDFATPPRPKLQRNRVLMQLAQSPAYASFLGRRPMHVLNFDFVLHGKAEIRSVEDFFVQQRGKWGSFWVPSWHAELEPTATIANGGNTVTISPVGYQANYLTDSSLDMFGRYIFLLHREGDLHISEVTSCAGASPEVLTIATPVDREFAVGDYIVGFLYFVRFLQDELEMEFIGGEQAQARLAMQEVPGDTYVEAIADPPEGGTIAGGGGFRIGQSVTVTATPSLPVSLDVGADIAFVADESSSMAEIGDIMDFIVTGLEADLIAAGIGSGSVPNRYSLVAFGMHSIATEVEVDWLDAAAFLTAIAGVGPRGATGPYVEDAYDGIHFAIENLVFRNTPGVTKLLFVLTDEDRNIPHVYTDGADDTEQRANIKAEMLDGGFVCAMMINPKDNQFRNTAGQVVLAGDYTTKSYRADGAGGYTVTAGFTNNGTFSNGDSIPGGTTDFQYFQLMMDTDMKGYVFGLNHYRAGGTTRDSIKAVIVPALQDRIVEELAWTFLGWYDESGTQVSTDLAYTFTVTGNRKLEARFEYEGS